MGVAVKTVLALAIAASAPGCALLASANAAHSHITGCVGDPTFATIDVVLGTLGAGALVYAEVHPGWLAVPGVFVLSGVVGTITAYNCRHPDGDAPKEYVPVTTPYQPYQPTGDAPAPSSASSEDPLRDVHVIKPETPPAPTTLRLDLDPDYLRDQTQEPAKSKDDRIACSIQPMVACPDKQSCVLVDGTRGYCKPD